MSFFPSHTRLGKVERKIALSQKRASDAASRKFDEQRRTAAKAEFKAARRYLRTEPSLFRDPAPAVSAEVWAAADAANVRPVNSWVNGRCEIKWHTTRKGTSYGCKCDSCKLTSRYMQAGFERWPTGEPKGAAASGKEYRAHAKHCGSDGLPKPWTFKAGQPPKFNTAGLVMPIAQAPKYVLDFIARGPKRTEPILPGRDVRPLKVVKVPRLIALARELRKAA